MVKSIVIILLLYLAIGVIITLISLRWAEKNDPEFFKSINDEGYFSYILIGVINWLPNLIKFIKEK